jgi:trk system potassium uptake protein TrkH
VITGDLRALWDNLEIRYWWRLLAAFVLLIMVGVYFHRPAEWSAGGAGFLSRAEDCFRLTSFQVVSILTTTGFGTQDIGSNYFPPLARQLFLAMMIIGGCVGSTGGGIKVQRVAILTRSVLREIFKLRVPKRASSGLVVDGRVVPESEIDRVAALFFAWIGLLLVGGGVTALCTNLGALESVSGMFSALGNIGPCFISVREMVAMPALVKVTYVLGMLAGRLEILPVLLIFSRRAWS